MSTTFTQGCRFDFVCKRTGKYSEKPGSHCLHNGGCDCAQWRRLTDEAMGWDKPLPGRSWSNNNDRRGF